MTSFRCSLISASRASLHIHSCLHYVKHTYILYLRKAMFIASQKHIVPLPSPQLVPSSRGLLPVGILLQERTSHCHVRQWGHLSLRSRGSSMENRSLCPFLYLYPYLWSYVPLPYYIPSSFNPSPSLFPFSIFPHPPPPPPPHLTLSDHWLSV